MQTFLQTWWSSENKTYKVYFSLFSLWRRRDYCSAVSLSGDVMFWDRLTACRFNTSSRLHPQMETAGSDQWIHLLSRADAADEVSASSLHWSANIFSSSSRLITKQEERRVKYQSVTSNINKRLKHVPVVFKWVCWTLQKSPAQIREMTSCGVV